MRLTPLTLLGVLLASTASGATIDVTTTDDIVSNDSDCSLREAITVANADSNASEDACTAGSGDDVINVPAGTYTIHSGANSNEDNNANGDLDVKTNMTITGAGKDATFLQGSRFIDPAPERILHLGAGATNPVVTLSGLSFTRGGDISNPGGAVLKDGTGKLTIQNCLFEGNVASQGGGLDSGASSDDSELEVTGSEFYDNTSQNEGGAIDHRGNASLTDTTIDDNTSGSGGGYLQFITGDVTFTNCHLDNNQATGGGGAIKNNATSSITIIDSTLDGNTASGAGGAIDKNNPGNLTIQNTSVNDNVGQSGGAINFGGDILTISDGTSLDNNSAFSGQGGGISFQGTNGLSVTDSSISGNNAKYQGGGVFFDNGMGANGNAVILRSQIDGNSLLNVSANGGGLFFSSGAAKTLTVTDSSLSENENGGRGGGIYAPLTNAVTISNSTLSSNVAGGGGGAFYNAGTGSSILNSTLDGNTSSGAFGGAIENSGTLTVKNSVISNSIGAVNCVDPGTLTSLGHNIDTANSCAFAAAGDQPNTDPKLGPLALNGGTTRTQNLATDSPAIDNGDNTGCPAADQRGITRPLDGDGDTTATCDVGALEYNNCGDGSAGPGEECDDGNSENTDDCLNTCLSPTCGDGFVHDGAEQCDDGNTVDGDDCNADCTIPLPPGATTGGDTTGGDTTGGDTTGGDTTGGDTAGSDDSGGCSLIRLPAGQRSL
jgi:CSLREA domain-containing protein